MSEPMNKKTWRLYGKEYDFTDFLDDHPGGAGVIRKLVGKDQAEIEEAFEDNHADLEDKLDIMADYEIKLSLFSRFMLVVKDIVRGDVVACIAIGAFASFAALYFDADLLTMAMMALLFLIASTVLLNLNKIRNKMKMSSGTTSTTTIDPSLMTYEETKKQLMLEKDANAHKRVKFVPKKKLFTYSEFIKHDNAQSLWTSFKGQIYDISTFVEGHPGLKTRLLLCGGKDLEPFFRVYPDHYMTSVRSWMNRFQIGQLSTEDAILSRKNTSFDNCYTEEPERAPDLLGNTHHPFNGEPLLERLGDNFHTPNELFYVRNHLSVPSFIGGVVDPEHEEIQNYTVSIRKGLGITKDVELTYAMITDPEQKLFKHRTISCTLQCSGNRREDYNGSNNGGDHIYVGPHWVTTAISNAEWKGVLLRDVLKYCGLDVEDMALYDTGHHVHFGAHDHDETGLYYAVSIPIEKAIDRLGDCLIAFEMNGKPLPRDHGFPLRTISPGFSGVRSCKWLKSIWIEKSFSMSPWQNNAYRLFAPDIRFEDDLYQWTNSEKIDLSKAPIVYEMPVQSLICYPPPNSKIGLEIDEKTGKKGVFLRGIAWSGAGCGILRVDVSIDGGKHFTASDLVNKPANIKEYRMKQWSWVMFEKLVILSEEQEREMAMNGGKVSIVLASKALNGHLCAQPERAEPYYNARGVCINQWYKVPVMLDSKKPIGAIERIEFEPNEFRNMPDGGKFLIPRPEFKLTNSFSLPKPSSKQK